MNKVTNRTQDEIVSKIKEWENDDWMGTKRGDLIEYLDYEHAKEFLKPEVTEAEWKQTKTKPAKQIADYMEFAWDKANNFRGLSAGRSIDHMEAWLWLDGKDDFLREQDIQDYEYYGKPQLIAICELYGIDHKQYDDGVRLNQEP